MSLEVPRSLSPSKVSSFRDCPLAFRVSIIDHLPQPSSPHAVKGTLVHSTLEGLLWNHPSGERTREHAEQELEHSWAELQDDPEFVSLELSTEERDEFLRDAGVLVDNYFLLEDPNSVHPVGVELGLEIVVGSMRLRGIIDRFGLKEHGA